MADAQGKKTPSDFLKGVLGRPVDVKLNNGVEYKGVLACLDGFMNIAMEQTQEYVNGQLKAQYGDCFIRGNNGAWPSPTTPALVTCAHCADCRKMFLPLLVAQSCTFRQPSNCDERGGVASCYAARGSAAVATFRCEIDTDGL
jgi:U6 snRNA-associated Sm-like protein LSm6